MSIVIAGISMAVIFIVFDWYMIEVEKRSPVHWIHWLIRFAFIGIYAVIFETIWAVIPLYLIVYTLFDPGLNLMRGKPFFYLGYNSFWDRIFKNWVELLYALRLIMSIAAASIYELLSTKL